MYIFNRQFKINQYLLLTYDSICRINKYQNMEEYLISLVFMSAYNMIYCKNNIL